MNRWDELTIVEQHDLERTWRQNLRDEFSVGGLALFFIAAGLAALGLVVIVFSCIAEW